MAEPIRLVFAYAGVEYEDVRLDREKDNWPALKANYPWGTLPVLEIDGKMLAQSLAILRYLGKQFNLAGDTAFESGKCDEMVEAMADLGNASRTTFMEPNAVKKAEMLAKLKEETFSKFFGKWNEILEKNGGFLVGKRFSYADICIATFLQLYNDNLGEGGQPANLFEKYPALQAHQEKVFNAPGIKEWVEKRPKTQW